MVFVFVLYLLFFWSVSVILLNRGKERNNSSHVSLQLLESIPFLLHSESEYECEWMNRQPAWLRIYSHRRTVPTAVATMQIQLLLIWDTNEWYVFLHIKWVAFQYKNNSLIRTFITWFIAYFLWAYIGLRKQLTITNKDNHFCNFWVFLIDTSFIKCIWNSKKHY